MLFSVNPFEHLVFYKCANYSFSLEKLICVCVFIIIIIILILILILIIETTQIDFSRDLEAAQQELISFSKCVNISNPLLISPEL